MYTEAATEEVFEAALQCARGCYQRALIRGTEAWSGATLRGTARSYGYWYGRSRVNLLRRLTAAGIPWHEERRAHGKRVVVLGEGT